MDIAKLRKKAGRKSHKPLPDSPVSVEPEVLVDEEAFFDEAEAFEEESVVPGSNPAQEFVVPEEGEESEDLSGALTPEEMAKAHMIDSTVEYLSFVAADEPYALRIARVVEIIKPRDLSVVPRSERHICGVISLRGEMIPVLDLMVRLDLRQKAYLDGSHSEQPRIIILARGEARIGLFVDEVTGVVRMNEDLFEDADNVQGTRDHRFIRAIGKVEEGFVIVLDIDEIFSEGEN